MRRFERIHDVVEPVEEYRRGGYHPVHLHDVFDSRYEVIGKLAFGQFSTVWLARDVKLDCTVALKILKSDASSKDNKELAIYRRLSDSEEKHPGKGHVLQLLNHFTHDSPNGTHLCLVFPVMLDDGDSMTITGRARGADYVQTISNQLLLGLDFLHRQGIIHCDLQPANIMFSVASAPTDDFLQPPKFSPVRWLDGVEMENSAPKYLMATQRFRGRLDGADYTSLLVKIGDLGGAIQSQQCDEKPVTPTALRAPELIRRETWDVGVDIWALGCLIFEFATNEPLFPLMSFGLTREQIEEEHATLINEVVDDSPTDNTGRFATRLMERLPSGFGQENMCNLASFLESMLQRDPRSRQSAAALLQHVFLAGEPQT